VGCILRVGSERIVSVMVGSRVKVVSRDGEDPDVGEAISRVGELVAVLGSDAVGCNVAGGIVADGSRVRVGEGEGTLVAGAQAARMANRVQVRKKQRCMLKLYP
jgi:hypothetical protein